MILSIDTDSGLTVYVLIRDSNDLIANGTGTEIYNASHWASLYKISAPEQGVSGHYQVTVPAYLVAGVYSVTFYQQSGGSAVPGDSILGVHNFTIPTSSTLPTAPTSLIARLRILANDTSVANFISQESLLGAIDGSNVYFRLRNRNIVPASVYVTQGTSFRSQSGFTVDSDNGIVTFSVAPAAGTKPLEADYNFQWFSDTEYTQFLNDAARFIVATGDPTTVPDALQAALLQFGLYGFYNRRATLYANKYASTGGNAGDQVDTVTKNFLDLAKNAFKNGIQTRDDYYKKLGQQADPASGVATYNMDPFSPRR